MKKIKKQLRYKSADAGLQCQGGNASTGDCPSLKGQLALLLQVLGWGGEWN